MKKKLKVVPIAPRTRPRQKEIAIKPKDAVPITLFSDPLFRAIEDKNAGLKKRVTKASDMPVRAPTEKLVPSPHHITVTNISRLKAQLEGDLPHEFLLKLARGEAIAHTRVRNIYEADGYTVASQEIIHEEVYADMPTRIDCAKAAAPYYAPKLAAQVVKFTPGGAHNDLRAMDDRTLDMEISALKTIVLLTNDET